MPWQTRLARQYVGTTEHTYSDELTAAVHAWN